LAHADLALGVEGLGGCLFERGHCQALILWIPDILFVGLLFVHIWVDYLGLFL
jgi:hypothetical protein